MTHNIYDSAAMTITRPSVVQKMRRRRPPRCSAPPARARAVSTAPSILDVTPDGNEVLPLELARPGSRTAGRIAAAEADVDTTIARVRVIRWAVRTLVREVIHSLLSSSRRLVWTLRCRACVFLPGWRGGGAERFLG